MIKQNVTSLELSKELFLLEIEQKTLFRWEYINDKCYDVKFFPYCTVTDFFKQVKLYSAFTSSELLEIIPHIITIKENEPFNNFKLRIEKFTVFIDEEFKTAYLVSYVCDTMSFDNPFPQLFHKEWDINLSNALAKMIIFLHRNNLWNG